MAAGCAVPKGKATGTGAIDAGPNAAGWACLVFAPVTWSVADTEDTIRQIRAHNAAWDAVCGNGGLQ